MGFDVTGLDVGLEVGRGELLGSLLSVMLGPSEIVRPTLGIPKG